jgi:hypothetical protein
VMFDPVAIGDAKTEVFPATRIWVFAAAGSRPGLKMRRRIQAISATATAPPTPSKSHL